MIIGTGSDMVDIRRIEKALARFGDRFIHRCFTPAEIERAESLRPSGKHIATYAKRFAAKEACAKALGTGIAQGVFMRDIGVVNDKLGKPSLVLTGGAQKRLQAMTPSGKTAFLHLTLSDDPPFGQASVIIEAE
jgi:holo-[acyl-carrier protein] synthase